MLIFLYGSNTYLLKEKLREIIEKEEKRSKQTLRVIRFDFREDSFEELRHELLTPSIFGEKKIAILEHTFEDEKFKANFLKNSQKFLPGRDLIIFYQEGSVSKGDKLFKFLQQEASCHEFKALAGQQLMSWVKKEFGRYQVKIKPAVQRELIGATQGDLWRLGNEIKKLASFKKGSEVALEDVKLHVSPGIETAIFKTIDELAQRNKKKALHLMQRHLVKGDSPLYLFTMVIYQFRNLLLVKDLLEKGRPLFEIQKRTALHPFVVKKTFSQARLFTLAELKKAYQKLFKLDFQIKVGKLRPEAALELFVTQL